MYHIDVKETTEQLIQWIRDYFDVNAPEGKAVIGISGGKDSTVVAALLVKALTNQRVFAVLMPQDKQNDIADSYTVCDILDIPYCEVNIGGACTALYNAIDMGYGYEQYAKDIPAIATNTPARMRMATLYAIAATMNGRVACTSNASEAYVGYSTKWGDGVGDFAPLRNLTTEEVCAIGIELGLPEDLVYKTPSDGMSGLSDEDKLGFKYRDVNIVLRDGGIGNLNPTSYVNIIWKHGQAEHKLNPIPMFKPNLIEGD